MVALEFAVLALRYFKQEDGSTDSGQKKILDRFSRVWGGEPTEITQRRAVLTIRGLEEYINRYTKVSANKVF